VNDVRGHAANPFLDAAFGFSRGFDHFDASFAALSTPGGRVNESALAWMRAREPGVPVFVYPHYMGVHGPYDARPAVLDPMLDALERSGPRERLDDAAAARLGYLRTFPGRGRYKGRSRYKRPISREWTGFALSDVRAPAPDSR
jgi:hypothetical protein